MPVEPVNLLRAQLHHLAIESSNPERLAEFYARALRLEFTRDGDRFVGTGPERCVVICPGRDKALAYAAYAVDSVEQLPVLRERVVRHGGRELRSPTALFAEGAVCVADPDGNFLIFGVPRIPASDDCAVTLRARLQHVVVASRDCVAMAQFYERVLGFTLSDKVVDEEGAMRTAFLRSGVEHHTFAVFQASENRLDHHCYEAGDWGLIRDWADYMTGWGIPIQWGPGRHGPGNNLFIFVHDADGNWVELSAELERVSAGRPVGVWPHEQRTLNLWGQGLMRS
jgi:catechol 2,3-dioxygenase-like lactoylglutathione lyase family enzyme